MRKEEVFFVLVLLILLFMGSAAASECIDCHRDVTPEIVDDFRSGAMADIIECSGCHGSAHNSAFTVDNAKMPTHETCAACHAAQDAQVYGG